MFICWSVEEPLGFYPPKPKEEADSIIDHPSVAVTGRVLLLQCLATAFLLLEAALTTGAGRGCHLPSL